MQSEKESELEVALRWALFHLKENAVAPKEISEILEKIRQRQEAVRQVQMGSVSKEGII